MANRIDALREYLATAAAGISIGAALMIVVPVDLMRAAGLENADQGVAIKTAVCAAAVSMVARITRINIRRK
jgi:hypothetical protein